MIGTAFDKISRATNSENLIDDAIYNQIAKSDRRIYQYIQHRNLKEAAINTQVVNVTSWEFWSDWQVKSAEEVQTGEIVVWHTRLEPISGEIEWFTGLEPTLPATVFLSSHPRIVISDTIAFLRSALIKSLNIEEEDSQHSETEFEKLCGKILDKIKSIPDVVQIAVDATEADVIRMWTVIKNDDRSLRFKIYDYEKEVIACMEKSNYELDFHVVSEDNADDIFDENVKIL